MWYSVELVQDKTIFIQTTADLRKHGPKGKVLLPHCLYDIAIQIQREND